MALTYAVYGNHGSGGPVDETTPLVVTPSLAYLTAALAHPGDWTFLVRARDTVTGWEDTASDARVRLVLDASGADITNRPAAPTDLAARPTENGGFRVEWAALPVPGATIPTQFKVWVAIGAINYAATPTALVAYVPGVAAYAADLTGFVDGTLYTIGVRASNASGDETNTATVPATADAIGPLPVENLNGVPTY